MLASRPALLRTLSRGHPHRCDQDLDLLATLCLRSLQEEQPETLTKYYMLRFYTKIKRIYIKFRVKYLENDRMYS